MSATTNATIEQVQRLERELYRAYDRLGISRTPLPPVQADDPASLELHLQWVEKEIRLLDRLLQTRAERGTRRRDWRETLSALRPSRFTARLSQLGLADPATATDPFGEDHEFYERVRPLVRFLFEEFWRVEVDGIQHVPSHGAGLLAANHAGLLPFDTLMLRYAVEELHPAGRVPRFLIENWFMGLPAINLALKRLGALSASQENASYLLARDYLVGLFPEGQKGVTKPYRERYRVQRFGRGGTIRLALRHQVPLIPVGVVGSEEVYPVLGKVSLPRRRSELNFLPITPTFPHFGLFGMIPLPSKWMIRFGEPIDISSFPPETADDDITVNTLNEELRQRVQGLVNHLLQKRRNPYLG